MTNNFKIWGNRINFKCLSPVLAASLVMLFTDSASALSMTFTDSLPASPLNFSNNNLTLSKFDPSLGTLTSFDLTFSSNTQGVIRFESLEASPAIVIFNLAAISTLDTSIFGIPDVVLNPSQSSYYNVSNFDGILDFSGTSGSTVNGLTAPSSISLSGLTTNLPAITGVGSYNLTFSSISSSSFTGAANLLSQIQQSADGNVSITYNYDPIAVPFEFNSGLGLSVLAGLFVGKKVLKRTPQKR
ncbi:choice-of-anchor E domain-containing protein [Cronbergia sp. UHCC 0137]|uniref:PFE-CTERM domain-containing protein n=1 Tax=Cronbergia sp. UHCC 0137 TaxID=3110239 RepID=UPI002B21CC7A|nr:choice-of-anchor E domain-containing protein [Cronbergia sp. UHCC 0137]MEA5618887.1 choice-of-anchor E domain-containing protein [Cronbergia sp. UHCC 0137]